MADIEQKLQQFSRSVFNEARQLRDKLDTQNVLIKKEKYEEAELEALKKMYEKIQHAKTRYSSETNRAILAAQMEGKTIFMHKRKSICDEVFSGVKDRLDNFIKTKEYSDFMIQLAKSIIKQLGDGNKNLMINKTDIQLLPVLKENIKDASISIIDKEDIIGGIIGYNLDKNTVIDESFLARMEFEKEHFIKISGLSID